MTTRKVNLVKPRGKSEGESNGNSKLSTRSVMTIKEQLRKGVPKRLLARIYGVSPGTIRFIAAGATWGSVKGPSAGRRGRRHRPTPKAKS